MDVEELSFRSYVSKEKSIIKEAIKSIKLEKEKSISITRSEKKEVKEIKENLF